MTAVRIPLSVSKISLTIIILEYWLERIFYRFLTRGIFLVQMPIQDLAKLLYYGLDRFSYNTGTNSG